MFDTFAGLVTADPLTDPASARAMFALLAEHAPDAYPRRWGLSEPLTAAWEPGMPADRDWPPDFSLVWRPAEPTAAEGDLSPPDPGQVGLATVAVSADRARVAPRSLAAFLRAAAVPLRAQYGYLHVAGEADGVPGPARPAGAVRLDGDGEPFLYVPASGLAEDGLAELYWGAVLGPDYVALAGGAAAVEGAPAHAVERLGPDTYWLQVTADPTDPRTDWPAFDAARRKVRAHLGEDLFWSRDRRPRAAPRRPEWARA